MIIVVHMKVLRMPDINEDRKNVKLYSALQLIYRLY